MLSFSSLSSLSVSCGAYYTLKAAFSPVPIKELNALILIALTFIIRCDTLPVIENRRGGNRLFCKIETVKSMVARAIACFVLALAVFLVLRWDAGNEAAAAGTGPTGKGAAKCSLFSEEELKGAEALSVSAAQGDNDLVTRAREWAGTNVMRRIWVCDIARNAKRVDALAVLARDALDACRGGDATYGRLFRTAKFLEECHDWTAAREALELAAPLAKYRTYREDIAFARLRVDLADAGISPERLDQLRCIATSATMNDNRLAAARLLKTYER